MEDHSVGRLLRELPRETARPGFTQRVLARLDAPAQSAASPRAWRLRLAVAAMALLAVVSAGVVRHEQSREAARQATRSSEARRALQEIRAEHDRIERELRALSEPPVIYLGGDERMDLVVDLNRIPAEDGPEPATYRYDTF